MSHQKTTKTSDPQFLIRLGTASRASIEYRKRTGLTQAQLAEKIGASQYYISWVESRVASTPNWVVDAILKLEVL